MSKKTIYCFLVFCLVTVLIGCTSQKGTTSSGRSAGPLLPWKSSGLKVGYIRSDVITKRHAEYRDADNTLRSDNRKWLTDAERMERDVSDKEAELEELSLILSPERKKQIEEEIIEARKELQKFQHETWYDENSLYIKRRRELMEPIDTRVNDAIWKVAEREGFDIVFDTVAGNIVFVKPEFDLTEKVVEELQE